MIWSVSTLLRRSGATRPVGLLDFSIRGSLSGSVGGRARAAGAAGSSSGVLRWPVTAVAAATSGETRWVRPPLPWRPSKLRLEVEALRSPGLSLSGFIDRHIEQPADRQSAP